MKRTITMLLLLICFTCLCGCSGNKEASIKYVDGTIEDGKSINDYYDLVGEASCEGVCGKTIVSVWSSETADGGTVVWSGNYYSYSDETDYVNLQFHLVNDVMNIDVAYDEDDF